MFIITQGEAVPAIESVRTKGTWRFMERITFPFVFPVSSRELALMRSLKTFGSEGPPRRRQRRGIKTEKLVGVP